MNTVQPYGKFSFLVTWPKGIEPPMGCQQSYRVWFGTEAAMERSAEANRAEGALVLNYRADGQPVSTCQHHGIVDLEHTCRAPGETAGQFTSRALGYTRDV